MIKESWARKSPTWEPQNEGSGQTLIQKPEEVTTPPSLWIKLLASNHVSQTKLLSRTKVIVWFIMAMFQFKLLYCTICHNQKQQQQQPPSFYNNPPESRGKKQLTLATKPTRYSASPKHCHLGCLRQTWHCLNFVILHVVFHYVFWISSFRKIGKTPPPVEVSLHLGHGCCDSGQFDLLSSRLHPHLSRLPVSTLRLNKNWKSWWQK